MIRTLPLLLSLSLCCEAQDPATAPTEKVPLAMIQLGTKGGGGPIIAQQGESKEHARPYIHPLHTRDGKHVLTQFSPGHHQHQTGLYWGQTRVNGRDYFHNYKKDYWKHVENRQGRNVMEFHSELLDAEGAAVLKDKQVWRLRHDNGLYTIDMEWTGTAVTDVTIGKYDYGGLFLRMPWKSGVKAECINSEGQKNEAAEGMPAKWVDLAMEIEGMKEMAHIAIIDHPKNPGYPTLWRIDGQFGIGPALARRGDVKIPKGESLTYRYRLVVYEGEHKPELLTSEAAGFGAE